MGSLFITGTDTEVGKTVVTASLAAAMRSVGADVQAIKPLATGSPPPGEDAMFIAAAAGHAPIVYQCLPTAASPDRAAKLEGRAIDTVDVVRWVRAFDGPLLVEGVGGWQVPLAPGCRISDIAMTLGFPVLIVAANRLGVLSHTILTVEQILRSGLTVAGVVLNNAFGCAEDLARWNLEDLRQELTVPVVPMGPLDLAVDLEKTGQRLLSTLKIRL